MPTCQLVGAISMLCRILLLPQDVACADIVKYATSYSFVGARKPVMLGVDITRQRKGQPVHIIPGESGPRSCLPIAASRQQGSTRRPLTIMSTEHAYIRSAVRDGLCRRRTSRRRSEGKSDISYVGI